MGIESSIVLRLALVATVLGCQSAQPPADVADASAGRGAIDARPRAGADTAVSPGVVDATGSGQVDAARAPDIAGADPASPSPSPDAGDPGRDADRGADATNPGTDAANPAADAAIPGTDAAGAQPTPWPAANAIIATVTAAMPVFPERRCSVKQHGATGDGRTDDTEAFAKAIAACASAGGGHVDVPAGSYVSGAITLLDNIDLHFERGATILFSGDPSKYPIVRTRYEGIELMNRSPMIYAFQRKNIAITGPGVLDASATAAWNRGAGRGTLEAWANANRPVDQRTGHQCRTSFVQPYLCENVYIQGITLRGAQFWQFHPVLSKNVLFDGVSTVNSGTGNNDGLDPESCDHVVVKDSSIKARDDAMAIKSGRDADGRRLNVPTTNLVILRTSMASSNWGMITIGSELSAGIRNVYAHDIKVDAGDRVKYVLELKGSSQRGGFATNINLDKITVTNGVSGSVFFADMSYMNQRGPYMPRYDQISLDRLTVDGAPRVLDLNGVAMTAQGATFHPIGPVRIANSTFRNIANPSNLVSNVTIQWVGSTINGQPAR